VSDYVRFGLAEMECCSVRKQSHEAKRSLELEMNGEQLAPGTGVIFAVGRRARASLDPRTNRTLHHADAAW
jgi:hypothetical protein